MSNLVGQQIGNYHIVRMLDENPTMQLYLARDIHINRQVILRYLLNLNDEQMGRFIVEMQSIAALRHPHIETIYKFECIENGCYLITGLIEGFSLGEVIQQYQRSRTMMPYSDTLRIVEEITQALDHTHRMGVNHGALSAGNIMIDQTGRVILTGFISSLNDRGIFSSSDNDKRQSPYIAPEQLNDQNLPQSDMYALGVVLFQLLTGHFPFQDTEKRLTDDMPHAPSDFNPDLPLPIDAVLQRLLDRDPEERFSDGQELFERLSSAFYGQPANERPTRIALPPYIQPDEILTVSTITLEDQLAYMKGDRSSSAKHSTEIIHSTPLQNPQYVSQPVQIAPAPVHIPPPNYDNEQASTMQGLPLWVGILGLAMVCISFTVLSTVIGLLVTSDNEEDMVSVSTKTSQPATATAFIVGNDAQSNELLPTTTETYSIPSIPSTLITPITSATSAPAIAVAATEVEPNNTATATFTFEPPTPLPPSKTPTLTQTPTPTLTMTLTHTPTHTLTPTNTSPFTTTPTYTATNTPTQTATEVVGRLVRLFYDDYSFYMLNTTSDNIWVNRLAMEALDSNGETVGIRFEGNRWSSVGYDWLEGGKCNTIEITESPAYLRPSECGVFFANYNAIVTPQRSSNIVFWLQRSGITHFRVLWRDEEVGRCDVTSGGCDVRIPY